MKCLLCELYFEILINSRIYIDQWCTDTHTTERGQYFHCATRTGTQKFNSGNYRYFGNVRAEAWHLVAGNIGQWNTIPCFIRILSIQNVDQYSRANI